MRKNEFERRVLEQVERMSRRDAKASVSRNGGKGPWPNCGFILHQPKRPKA